MSLPKPSPAGIHLSSLELFKVREILCAEVKRLKAKRVWLDTYAQAIERQERIDDVISLFNKLK